jgi:hypothetical protein
MKGLFGGNSKGPAEATLDQKLAQVEDLTVKLEVAEAKIHGMVSAAVPKVQIRLPKLNPSTFGKTARQDPGDRSAYVFNRLPLLNIQNMMPTLLDREPPASVAAAAVATEKKAASRRQESAAEKKAAEMAAKAAAAERAAQEAAGEMEEQASKLAAEAQARARKRFLAPLLAALTSVAISLALASTGAVGQCLGAVIAGQAAAVLNIMGLAIVWKGRAEMIFGVANAVFSRVKEKVVDVLDTVDDMIVGPLKHLEGAIDNMTEEQKPALEQMQQLERTLRKVDPSFDIPDPEDLKKPLDGCEAMIEDFVEKAKREVPEKLDEMADATFIGRMSTNKALFHRIAVSLPLTCLFLVNAVVAFLQVILTSPRAAAKLQTLAVALPAETVALARAVRPAAAERSLRGSSVIGVLPSEASFSFSSWSFPGELDFWPFLQPALIQIALALVQQLAILALSQGPRVCGVVNGAISSLENQVNKRVNMRVQGVVDQVFGTAFGEVKAQTTVFFPKFKGALGQLKEALKLAGQAEAAMQAASGAKNLLKRLF